MGFNSAFKGLKLLKTPGTGRLNNLNDPVLDVLSDRQKDLARKMYKLLCSGHVLRNTVFHNTHVTSWTWYNKDGTSVTHIKHEGFVDSITSSRSMSRYRLELCTWRRSWFRASWYNYKNSQQDVLYRLIYYSKSAVYVSGDVFAHHQQHLTVFTVSVSVHPSCCRLLCRMSWNCSFNSFGTAAGSCLGEH
jgi:hypothetical protein